MENKKTAAELDWEMSSDFYKEDGEEKELSIEDFIEDSSDTDTLKMETFAGNQELQKTIEDVRTVQKLAADGKTIDEIVQLTGMERQYVYNIQVCTQGFHEDDEIAVAHLVMMG